MNEHHPYERHLAEKLRHLPPPGDKDNTWEGMKNLLDKEMPRGGGMSLYRRWSVFGVVAGGLFLATWLLIKLPSHTAPETTAASTPKQTSADKATAAGQPVDSHANGSSVASADAGPSGSTAGSNDPGVPDEGAAHDVAAADKNVSANKAGTNIPSATVPANGNVGADRRQPGENDAGTALANKQPNTHTNADEAITTLKKSNSSVNNKKGDRPRNDLTVAGKKIVPGAGHTGRREKINGIDVSHRSDADVPGKTDVSHNVDGPGKTDGFRTVEGPGKTDALGKTMAPDKVKDQPVGDDLAIAQNANSQPSKPDESPKATKVRGPLRYNELAPRPELIQGPQIQKDYVVAGGWLPTTAPEQSTVAAAKKLPKEQEEGVLAIGLSLPLAFPLGDQKAMGYNYKAGHNTISDYLPSPHVQYHLNNRTYIQAEVQFLAPQFIRSTPLVNEVGQMGPNYYYSKTVVAKKLYYFNLPLTVHYSPFPGFYLGTGLQYSKLVSGVALSQEKRWNSGPGGGNMAMYKQKYIRFRNDNLSNKLNGSEFRLLLDMNYYWNKFTVGMRYNQAFSNYVSFRTSPAMPYAFDKNRALQFYLRYNIWEDRKRNKPASDILAFK